MEPLVGLNVGGEKTGCPTYGVGFWPAGVPSGMGCGCAASGSAGGKSGYGGGGGAKGSAGGGGGGTASGSAGAGGGGANGSPAAVEAAAGLRGRIDRRRRRRRNLGFCQRGWVTQRHRPDQSGREDRPTSRPLVRCRIRHLQSHKFRPSRTARRAAMATWVLPEPRRSVGLNPLSCCVHRTSAPNVTSRWLRGTLNRPR